MIFGVWNSEKIWHQQIIHLPTLPVYCDHFTLGNPKKSFFNSIIHTNFRLLHYLRRNKLHLLYCSLSDYLLLFTTPIICIALLYGQFFTTRHGMQTRSSDENSVCQSVCQTRALWQNVRKICLDFYIIPKNIYPSFLRRRIVGGGDPFYQKFWVNRPALERNRRFWTDNRS